MARYNVRLLHKNQVADGTLEFVLEKPTGLEYRAGQFFDIILPKPSEDARKSDYVHGFSFVTAPSEPYIAAATRMRPDSNFKNAFKNVPDGSEITIEAVWGSFTLKKNEDAPVVYIIGGIGITPVRSMLVQATADKLERSLTLIYANRSPANAAYTKEFEALAAKNSYFTFVPVYEDAQPGGGEHGRIDGEMVKRHVADVHNAIYYLSGPAGMVRASRDLLTELGIDEDSIRTEEFDGY